MATVPYGPGQGNPLNLTARLLPVGGWPAEGPHIGMTTSGTRQIRTLRGSATVPVVDGLGIVRTHGRCSSSTAVLVCLDVRAHARKEPDLLRRERPAQRAASALFVVEVADEHQASLDVTSINELTHLVGDRFDPPEDFAGLLVDAGVSIAANRPGMLYGNRRCRHSSATHHGRLIGGKPKNLRDLSRRNDLTGDPEVAELLHLPRLIRHAAEPYAAEAQAAP
jgi:hypothetical protein